MQSWFGFPLLRPPGHDPAEAQSLRLSAAVAAAFGCVPRGQRALLDADMLELIDRSACLVEPVTVESCAPPVLVLSPQQARPTPRPVVAHEYPSRGLVEGLVAPELLLPSCSLCRCRRFTATASGTSLCRGVLAARVRAHFACSPGRRRLDVSSRARHRLSVTFEMLG